MKKRKSRGLLIFLSITLCSIVFFGLFTKPGQRTLDIWQDELRTKQNYLHYRFNKPLPGTPDLSKMDERLAQSGVKLGAPIFMRIFKLEGELELWMRNETGFVLFATYPICRWSGRLGPKLKEGDRQSPEGIYTVRQNQLNPNSRWYRSFNLGYPNIYDRSFDRTGSFLMVHGGCSSIGCYAMTDPVMKEIWQIVTATYKGDNKSFTVHAFPFRMTQRNMSVYHDQRWAPLWANLKRAYDLFNETKVPPKVSVCKQNYVVTPGSMVKKTYQQSLKHDCSDLKLSSKIN